MKLLKVFAPLLVASPLLCSPVAARAYCRATTGKPPTSSCPEECFTKGLPFYWAVSSPRYIFNEKGFDDVDMGLVRAAIQRSFARWNAITCDVDGRDFPLGLNIQPRAGTSSLEVGPKEAEPNDNVIVYFSGERWLSDPTLNPAAYALTAVWYNNINGEILGADMHFNGAMGKFGVCSDDGCSDAFIDLENVATHEAGHFIGLAHSEVEGSTMSCAAGRSEINKRTLAADDIRGACATYPPGRSFVKDPLEEETDCSVGHGRHRAMTSLAFVALGLALMRRRTKPQR